MKSSFQIAFIVEHYPPTDGGLATSAQRIARELVSLGVGVKVFCFDYASPIDSEDFIFEENDQGVQVHRVSPFFIKQDVDEDTFSESTKSKLRRRAFHQITTVLKKGNVDCVLAFYIINSGYLGLLIARELNLPFVAGVRGNDIGKNIFHVERFAVTQWVANGATRIVCVNEYLKNRLLIAFPEVKSKTYVFQNGVVLPEIDIDKVEARDNLLKATGWLDDDVVLAFTGVLREKKGVTALLKGLSILADKSVKLLVVGSEIGPAERKTCGTYWDSLKNQGNIYCSGNISRKDVHYWLKGADIVLMPSLDDGMANGLLEGMALGLCPLVTDIFSDVIENGKNGVMVRPNDAEGIAKALRELIVDRDRITFLGNNAKHTIEINHRPREEALKYKELFEQIIPLQSANTIH